jgi:dehydrogenase/reductase SDR family protein 4
LDRLIDFTVQTFKSIDVLVPNVAVSTHFGPLMDISENAMKKMVNTNIIASLLLIQKSQPFMPVGSNIIIISSIEGYTLNPIPIGFYGVTKTALIALTKALSKELTDIRVNCIAPGLIKTKFSKMLWEGKEDAVKQSLEIDRLGEVDDIAHAAIYLSQATYVRGETIVVAGKTAPRL